MSSKHNNLINKKQKKLKNFLLILCKIIKIQIDQSMQEVTMLENLENERIQS